MKTRKQAFILIEAILSLMMITTVIIFEHEQLVMFKKQEKILKSQYNKAIIEREKAMALWQDYVYEK
ncbi:hypothetical protein [Leuconostoc palmae]|uniref:hypothetical protein n=1 Tax=Leuconostoc palmae TaxID=501487 RepID=UPI001C7D341A|nr:hypothetical protein [Leuconostoc palmae]